MYPLLRNERDQVILAPCTAGEIRKMDVVLFRYRGIHVLHRVIHREGDRLWLQGDGICASCETCTTADVVALLQRVVRPSGRELEVKGWRWRLASRLWRGIGPLRLLFLRLASHQYLTPQKDH